MFGADCRAMTSKNSGVSASTTMSSLGKACLELSKSIKGFRFSRQAPQDTKDAVSTSGHAQCAAAATASNARPPLTAEDGCCSVSGPTDDVTSGVPDGGGGATGGGSSNSVTSTISRVIRSATNRVRAFPSSPQPPPRHQQPVSYTHLTLPTILRV